MSEMAIAVISELKADAPVAAIVGTQIYNTIADPDAAPPYVTLQTMPGGEQSHDQSGASGLVFRRLQLNLYPATLAQGRTLMAAVYAAIDGLFGVTIGTVPNALAIRSLLIIEDWDDFYAPKAGAAKPGWIVRAELEGWH